MVATFHLHCLGHRIKYGNPEVGNTTQQFLSTTRRCCSIEFIESLLFLVILVTYNISIYICVCIFTKLTIFILFLLSSNVMFFLHYTLNVFWDMKKYFVKLMSRLLHSTIHQVMWYLWVFIVNLFSLLWSFFLKKLCFLWFPCLLLIAESISIDTSGKPTVGFFLKIASSSWIILSISLNELNSSDWLLKRWWWIFLK